MHDDLVKLLAGFLKQVRLKRYGQNTAGKAIKSVQYFAQVYSRLFKPLTLLTFDY